MYFTLTVNEQLANAMRAAAEFKAEVEKVINGPCSEGGGPIEIQKAEYAQMSNTIGEMMIQIGGTIGLMMADTAFQEAGKAINATI